MELDWKLRLFLWLWRKRHPKPMHQLTPVEFRQAYAQPTSSLAVDWVMGKPIDLLCVIDRFIPGRNGRIPIRVYQPNNHTDLPVILFYHGGGWVLGDLDSHDIMCRRLAHENQCIVVAVDYRLAPEHKYPAAVEDAYDALLWVSQHAHTISGNGRLLSVMGDSAGGNLAAVVCLMARDMDGPPINAQILIYPSTDATLQHTSLQAATDTPILNLPIMRYFVQHYGRSPADAQEPYFSPLLAPSLHQLPPALVITAEHDPLRDEGRAYAERLLAAGNQTRHIDMPGMIHAFMKLPNLASGTKEAYAAIATFLQETAPGRDTLAPHAHA